MRRRSTRAERILWHALRGKQLYGLKFRRQVPIGPYIGDFFCPSARLIVEVDGITHVGRTADAKRDAWMRGQGLSVLRVWDDEVTANLEGVLRAVYLAGSRPVPPTPSCKGSRSFCTKRDLRIL
jgi:very-short-patch-repair endonuclease